MISSFNKKSIEKLMKTQTKCTNWSVTLWHVQIDSWAHRYLCAGFEVFFFFFFYSSSFVSIRFTMRFIHRIVDILVSWCVNGTNNHCLATTICDQWGKNAACSVHKIVFYTLLPMGSSCIGSKNAITILCLGKPF